MAFVVAIGAKVEAQSAIVAAGGEAGTVSFTVGQPFVEVAASNAGSVTPGVQQTYEIAIVDGIENTQVTLTAEVYPNPVADRLTLRVDGIETANLRYTLTDNNGRTLATDEIGGAQTAIEMNHLTQGVYFLHVTNSENPLKTFKIIKN